MRKELNLENPQTFNEKLQWLKLYNRNPEYTRMVDKYEAKRYAAEIIHGKQKDTFEQSICQLNTIINDDIQLQNSFNRWIDKHREHTTSIFSSWHNRYLNAAASRGWLPYLGTPMEYGEMLNRICCESHRDITIAVLNDRISRNQ